MAKPTDGLDYLSHPAKHPAAGRLRAVWRRFVSKAAGIGAAQGAGPAGDDADFSVTVFDGRECSMRDVLDALSTRALFGGGRHLVIVDEADEFVSQNRPALEDYAADREPRRCWCSMRSCGPAPRGSTRRLPSAACRSSASFRRRLDCSNGWSAGPKRRTARSSIRTPPSCWPKRVETEMGLFDQELAKLASLAGAGGTITTEMVHEAVGGWRAKTAWDMLDAALAGDPRAALVQLDRLLLAGEVPIALLAQIGASLRRFAAAARLIDQAEAIGRPITLRQALEKAGVKSFLLGKAEGQLRKLGRDRADELYRRLLQADLALKGSSSSPRAAGWCSKS